MSPDIEASIITAASNWAIFMVGKPNPRGKIKTMQQLTRAFNYAHHSLRLAVQERLSDGKS